MKKFFEQINALALNGNLTAAAIINFILSRIVSQHAALEFLKKHSSVVITDGRAENDAPHAEIVQLRSTPIQPAVDATPEMTPPVETPGDATPENPAMPEMAPHVDDNQPATSAAENFHGLTLLPLSKIIVQAITQKLTELDANVHIDFHNTFAVASYYGKKVGRVFSVKFCIYADEGSAPLEKFALAEYDWAVLTAGQIKTLAEDNAIIATIVCTANIFYTKAAQYLGLISISPVTAGHTPALDKGGAYLPGFKEKHPTNNTPQIGDAVAENDDRAQYKFLGVSDWQVAFNAIQSLAPAKYSVKVYGGGSILYTADNGYGFEVLTYVAADAVVGKSMLTSKKIQRVTFGRVENGLLQAASATDKLIIFHRGYSGKYTKQELLDWLGLPANDTFALAELGKPVELARVGETITKDGYRRKIKIAQYPFTDAAKKFFNGGGKILADSQILFHTASNVVKYIITEDEHGDGLAMVPCVEGVVNPNGGEPFLEGVEYLDFNSIDKTVAFSSDDLPVFARNKRITKITLIPATKSARRA